MARYKLLFDYHTPPRGVFTSGDDKGIYYNNS